MSGNPLVSIIIPVYNTEKYLARCLDSVLAQTYPDIEVVCADDGSSDGGLAILESYAQADGRVRVLSLKHRGVSATRNAAIDAAHGEYITFVDSDDVITPGCIELLVEAIEGVDISFIGQRCFDRSDSSAYMSMEEIDAATAEGKLPYRDRMLAAGTSSVCEPSEPNLFTPLLSGVGSKLFRSELVHARDDTDEPTRFPTKYSFGEDTAFSLLYMRDARTMRTCDVIGYYYLCRMGNSLSYNNTINMYKILDLIRLWKLAYDGRWTPEIQGVFDRQILVLVSSFAVRISKMDLPYDQQKSLFENAVRQTGLREIAARNRPHDRKTMLMYAALRTHSYRIFWMGCKLFPSRVHYELDQSVGDDDAIEGL